MNSSVDTFTSARNRARVAATLFLTVLVTGIIAQVVIYDKLIVVRNAATTAANIAANPALYRLAFTLFMIEMIAQTCSVGLFYGLLKPVNRHVALTAAVIGFTGCGIKTFARLFYYAPLLLIGNATALSAFDAPQLQALSLAFILVNDQGAAIALIFFGLEAVLEGWLTWKSTYFPRWLGALSIVGGLGWLTYLWRPLADQVFPAVALIALVGSVATIGWMLIFGVREAEWRKVAAAPSYLV
jgi:hypothetical protein